MPAENKKRETAPPTDEPANDGSLQTVTVTEFAHLAGIIPRNARRAVEAAITGRLWRGHRLVVSVEQTPSGGGRGGKRYVIQVASLPQKFRVLLSSQQSTLAVSAATGEQ